jgi:hypothetical protein
MAYIKPSLKFEGSELNLTASSAPYIQENVRRAIFNKSNNPEGAFVYFLPPYRADTAGNGVWYKKISIRDNFGTKFKEKYFMPERASDPAEYFANNFKILYPEESRPTDTEINGRKFKQYPNFGRCTERVIYNVAFAQNLSAGAHVLDLPLRNGADYLMNWLEGRDMHGNPRQPINECDRCVPVFIKLKDNSSNPWTLQVESSSPVRLPDQLADSDYLYNLDQILIVKSKEEIISKLRDMYSSDVFEDCMDGYPGLTKSNRVSLTTQHAERKPAPAPVAPIPKMEIAKPEPIAQIAPVLDIPKVAMAAPVAPVNAPGAADISSLPANPMITNRLSRAEALKYINQEE